ncbi:MAG: hypothetical protein MK132_27125 [Lentisphaerales bacterium]|nr:hypothetical protein [Lentisphaerales bacterium]
MRNVICILVLLGAFSLNINAEVVTTKKGYVTKTMINATPKYRIDGLLVSRGSVFHIKDFVEYYVRATCVIVKDKIVRIKSIEVLSKEKDRKIASFIELCREYKSNRSEVIIKYRNKPLSLSAQVSSINLQGGVYVIGLEGKGRLYIDEVDMPKDINEILWQNRSKRKATKINFTAEWCGNQVGLLFFKNMTELSIKKELVTSKKSKKKKNIKKDG